MSETLWCESCGEAEQEVHLADAGLCGDCFAVAFREHVGVFFWNTPCGHPHFNSKGELIAVCVRQCGTEHDHSSVSIADDNAVLDEIAAAVASSDDSRKWLLVDYDGTGLKQIQARDEHPDRATFTDDDALAAARADAADGDLEAVEALAMHNRDDAALLQYQLDSQSTHDGPPSKCTGACAGKATADIWTHEGFCGFCGEDGNA